MYQERHFSPTGKVTVSKRFVIPHHKLGNSGGYMGWDRYIPDGRLIIVDRTPFSREWTDGTRGTSKADEGFPCQSKEGLNITAGVSIGASVLEENAAKYLYRFGVVAPQGDRTSGEVIFTSVYYSRKLAEVMDDVGRKKVQTLVCDEISARTFDDANKDAVAIMATVKDKAIEYFKSVGITLDFIGWADTFAFDKDVQKAVNDAYIANKLAGSVQLLQALGQIRVQEGLGKGLGDKGPPVVITPGMIDTILGAVKTMAPAAQGYRYLFSGYFGNFSDFFRKIALRRYRVFARCQATGPVFSYSKPMKDVRSNIRTFPRSP